MKTIKSFTYLTFLIFFMNGCSQSSPHSANYQSRTHSDRSTQYQNSSTLSQQEVKQTKYLFRQQKIQDNIPSRENSSPIQEISNPSRSLMVKIAKSTLGTPYKWGGTSPEKGFDCSGLMTYIHKNALGIEIPRTAAKQRDSSHTVNYNQLQPGDMLFFKTGKRTNHVGIYIGNRQFIHSPSGRKHVKIATMDSAYWHKRFIKFGTFL